MIPISEPHSVLAALWITSFAIKAIRANNLFAQKVTQLCIHNLCLFITLWLRSELLCCFHNSGSLSSSSFLSSKALKAPRSSRYASDADLVSPRTKIDTLNWNVMTNKSWTQASSRNASINCRHAISPWCKLWKNYERFELDLNLHHMPLMEYQFDSDTLWLLN